MRVFNLKHSGPECAAMNQAVLSLSRPHPPVLVPLAAGAAAARTWLLHIHTSVNSIGPVSAKLHTQRLYIFIIIIYNDKYQNEDPGMPMPNL